VSETVTAVHVLNSVADRFLLRNIALPNLTETAKLLRIIGATEASPAPPPADFLAKLRKHLFAASGAGLSGLSRRDLRYVPWLLWDCDPPAAVLPSVLHLVLEQARTSDATVRRLIQAYLRDFRPNAPGIAEAAECICRRLANDHPRLREWYIAQKEVELFHPRKGPATLAARLLSEKDPGAVLARYRLDDPMLATGGYMMAVEDAVRAAAPVMLRDTGTVAFERILKIVAPSEKLRFESHRADTARALLRAWLIGRGEPAPALQEPVRRILLRWLGDPRLRPQQWATVGEQETALMRRWLTRASLDLFFKLIDQHALDAQWRYRHAFWLAYLEKGAIADAWLALGSQTYSEASSVRELGGAYGHLRGGDAKQSALLLRIGPLVIGEFTHNGKLHIWPADWRNAPQLGRRTYERDELTGKCLPFPPNPSLGKGGDTTGRGLSHIGSNKGYWQGSAAELIKRRAGFGVGSFDWRPR